jgi:hypothetical protein
MPYPDRLPHRSLHKPLRFCRRCEVPMCFLGVLPKDQTDVWLYYCDCGEQLREVTVRPQGLAN